MSEISEKIREITIGYIKLGFDDFVIQTEGEENFLEKKDKKVILNISNTENIDTFIDDCLKNIKTTN